MEHLGALLLMYPRRRQFAKDFPELRAAIRGHFGEGAAPSSAALKIAADILADLLAQLDAPQKAALLASLPDLDPAEAKALAARRLAGDRSQSADPSVFAKELLAVAVFMARRMTEEGTLRREELHTLLKAVEGALGAEGAPLTDAFAKRDDARR